MQLTNDQYFCLGKLERWYTKNQHQFIEIAGTVGTGIWELLQSFFEKFEFDPREIMYLSYDQKQVLELAAKRYHAYYINGIIYKYTRIVDFDTIPIINPSSQEIEFEWKKDVRKRINGDYKIIVVFDSMLLNQDTIEDLSSFGLPVILIRDPMLLPAPDSFTFAREPNLILHELHPTLMRNPISYFAQRILRGEDLKLGNYDTVSIVNKKHMNLYNLKSANMVLTISEDVRQQINQIYRERIMKLKTLVNVPGERVIVMNDMYGHRLTNNDEKNIKVYLTRGTVGYIHSCYKHIETRRYVPFEFRPEFYHEPFSDLVMDRNYLNGVETPSRQIIPENIVNLQYAYALSAPMSRLSHWNKVTLVLDQDPEVDPELYLRLMYTAITRSKGSLTIVV